MTDPLPPREWNRLSEWLARHHPDIRGIAPEALAAQGRTTMLVHPFDRHWATLLAPDRRAPL